MAEESSQSAGETIVDQPPASSSPLVLDYRSARDVKSWRRLPRPTWITVVVLLLTAAAAYWLYADHAAWAVVRRFDGPLEGPPNGVLSADGKRLLAILADKQTIRVYDVATGKTVRDLRRPAGDVLIASFSPDGNRIWSNGTDGHAILWDVSSGQALATLAASDPQWGFGPMGCNYAAPFSPNGRWMAIPDGHSVLICDGHDGAVLTKLHTGWFPVFSPDSRYLAALALPRAREVRIWDTQTWQQVATLDLGGNGLSGQDGMRIAFSPDSKTLAMAFDTRVDLWDAATNQVSPAFTTSRQVSGCFYSPDGRYLMVLENNGGNLCEVWDMTARKCVGVVPNPGAVVISSDGKLVVTYYGQILHFPSLKPLAHVNAANPIAWVPGQQAFLTADAFGVSHQLWLFERRRPEAAYGLIWLPQSWLVMVGVSASAWLICRDLRRWRRNPPAL